ncbi:unnamed protein product [Diamesa serratosioi]
MGSPKSLSLNCLLILSLITCCLFFMHVASEDNIPDETQTVLLANDQKVQIDPPTEFNTKLLTQPDGETKTQITESSIIQLDLEKLGDKKESIPVFSEWAQLQEQQQQAEKKLEENQNSSEITRQNINMTGSKTNKLRQKNYANPDCGAKVLKSNPEAQSVNSVLSSHKDEYLLNSCNNKIWFIVELCEAIQLERIEVANFELFSSSLKELNMSISNRYPTRDWSNVGQFATTNQRDIQSFDLNPQLFGKFVRIQIDYTNQEHYCPLSLFRVFGTSEIEAFETDNQQEVPMHPIDDLDYEHNEVKKQDNGNQNIINRAGEAVMNIVKKAAGVLVKNDENTNTKSKNNEQKIFSQCLSMSQNPMCKLCNDRENVDVMNLLSCNNLVLMNLLEHQNIRQRILHSEMCQRVLGLNLNEKQMSTMSSLERSYETEFFISILPRTYKYALCNLIAIELNVLAPFTQTIPDNGSGYNQNLGITKNYQLPSVLVGEDSNNLKNLSKGPPKYKNEKEGTACEVKEMYNINQVEVVKENAKENVIKETGKEVEEYSKETNDNTTTELNSETVNIFNVIEDQEDPITKVQTVQFNETEAIEVNIIPEIVEQTKDTRVEVIINDIQVESDTAIDNLIDNRTLSEQKVFNPPESVFLRLSNRIRTLEKNVSLSSKYLEELSRRYKAQVEELQSSFMRALKSFEEHDMCNKNIERRDMEERNYLRTSIEQLSEKVETIEHILIIIGVVLVFQMMLILVFIKRQLKCEAQLQRTESALAERLLINSDHIQQSEMYLIENSAKSSSSDKKRKIKKRFRKLSAPNMPNKSLQESYSQTKCVSMENIADTTSMYQEDKAAKFIPNSPELTYHELESDISVLEVSSTVSCKSDLTNNDDDIRLDKDTSFKRRLSQPLFSQFSFRKKSKNKKAFKTERAKLQWYKDNKSLIENNLKAKEDDEHNEQQMNNATPETVSITSSCSFPDVTTPIKIKKSNNSSFKRFFKKLF